MEKKKTKQLGIRIPQSLWDRFKAACEAEYTTTYQVVRSLIVAWLNDKEAK